VRSEHTIARLSTATGVGQLNIVPTSFQAAFTINEGRDFPSREH
jgi:hypothetical protein